MDTVNRSVKKSQNYLELRILKTKSTIYLMGVEMTIEKSFNNRSSKTVARMAAYYLILASTDKI